MNEEHEIEPLYGSNARAKHGWFVGNMAQLTIFLSGIILTLIAFVALTVLMQKMTDDTKRYVLEETQSAVLQQLRALENSIHSSAFLLSSVDDLSDDDVRRVLISGVHGLSTFDRVLVSKQDGEGKVNVVDVLANNPRSYPIGSAKSLVTAISARIDNSPMSDVGTVFVSDVPGGQEWQEYTDPVIKSRVFAIAKTIRNEDGKNNSGDLVIGLIRLSSFLKKDWFVARDGLRSFSLKDMATGKTLFYMNKDFVDSASGEVDKLAKTSDFPLGTQMWQMTINVGSDKQASLLKSLPWVILGFCLLTTFIATMYVRSNQRQAFQLAVVNRQLAQKNYELNSEVNERERLNQSLRKAEREYRAIIDSVSDIIFETTVDGEITLLNDAWSKVTGIDQDHAIGNDLFDMIHPMDEEEQRQKFSSLVKGKKGAYRCYTRLKTHEGTYRSVELAVSMLRQDKNKNMRVVGTFTDVEERRRAEKALSEAEKKYRTIVENAAGGIYQVTLEGQFLSANPAMVHILGYTSVDDMMSAIRNVHEQIYVDARERAAFVRLLETDGVAHNYEMQVKTKAGVHIWVNENARAVKDDDGNLLYFEGSLEDITSRKEAEISLKEAKKQSDLASRAKSEFLANMSHELRTPLNAIIGFSEIIKDEVLGPLENKQYWDYARDIHASGQKLLKIISEILDVARIEAGERQLNEGIVRMNSIMKSSLDFMLEKAENAKLSVSDMTQGNLPDIIGEELAIKQIFLNIIGNAVKYTQAGGRITISHEIDKYGALRISISDTGLGMDPSEIEKALSPFGQTDSSLSRTDSGAGLGLTLSRSLMDLHEGELEIFSQKGIGTTATLVFPAKRVAVGDDRPIEDDESEDGNLSEAGGDDKPRPSQLH